MNGRYGRRKRGGLVLTLVALLVGAGSAAAQPRNMSIADAVAMTVSRHPQIAQALANLARGRAEVDAARSVWQPVLTYRGNIGPDSTSSSREWELNESPTGGGIALQQLIWDFGRSRGQIAAASAIERQRMMELTVTADQLAEQVALAFLEVKRNELLLEETARHLQSLERLQTLIRLRSDAGLSDRSDLMLAGVRVESARGEQIQIRTAHQSAEATLANLTGYVPDGYVDPSRTVSRFKTREGDPELDELPLVVAALEAERAAEARIDGVKAERLPRLGLLVGYDRHHYSGFDSTVRPNNALTALITVNGDLYRAGNRHSVRAALEERRAARAVREAVKLDLRGRILAVREQIEGGEARIEAFRNQEQHAVQTRDIFLEEYKLGKRNLSDLLSAELEIYRAAGARINAEYEVMRARIQQEAVYGSLRQSLGLATHLTENRER